MAFPGNKLKSLYKEGISCRNAGAFGAAKRCFKEIVLRDSSYALAYLQLAEIAALEEVYPESIGYYKHYLQLEEEQSGAWYTIGVLYFNTKEYSAAVTAFEMALAKGRRKDADICLTAGMSCLQMKATQKGIQYLENCLAFRPDDPRALQALAHHYYLAGSYQLAVSYWDRLLSIQPGNAFAMFMLGKSYIGTGEVNRGEALCDKALAAAPI
ncbi:tetratricopeptide repeat protein [Chitinophaga rhizophila]|uniref:Tetratricopeptide repeat protein n=1 Tax=Chitinophaga rhizophila TaxID=2866212 RepID=A0ABS7GC66_9BACT|nr:tetratricopeptide repeat protein [Chitinophaga rhizophila]MBW8685011.1 tetratricopeptide repeat protein [Chitinophaga rhizophila]